MKKKKDQDKGFGSFHVNVEVHSNDAVTLAHPMMYRYHRFTLTIPESKDLYAIIAEDDRHDDSDMGISRWHGNVCSNLGVIKISRTSTEFWPLAHILVDDIRNLRRKGEEK